MLNFQKHMIMRWVFKMKKGTPEKLLPMRVKATSFLGQFYNFKKGCDFSINCSSGKGL